MAAQFTKDIQEGIERAKNATLALKQDLYTTKQRVKELEEELLLYKERVQGIICRDQLNQYYQSEKGRDALDSEWDAFKKTFHFSLITDISIAVYDWIRIIGPLVHLDCVPSLEILEEARKKYS